jgi:hypothetical protein
VVLSREQMMLSLYNPSGFSVKIIFDQLYFTLLTIFESCWSIQPGFLLVLLAFLVPEASK